MGWSVPIAGFTTSTSGSTATEPAPPHAGLTRRDFLDWVRAAETDFPVTSWKIRGLHVWPMIRLFLSSSTFRAGSPTHSLRAGWLRLGGNVGFGLLEWAKARVADARANRSPRSPVGAVFLTSSIGRRPLLYGKRYDPRSGPFVDLLERAGVPTAVWEISPFGDYNFPRYHPSFFVQPHLFALRAACEVLSLGDDRVELTRYHEFLARVRAAGLDFPHVDVERLRRDVLYVRRLADLFSRWLRRARPRFGFLANASLVEQAFCVACRELGITSVEVQHGVQGELHPTYGSWSAVPPEGWEVRARVFWCWDENSAAAINRWAMCAPGRHTAIVGGDPWRELWASDNPVRAGVAHLIAARKRGIGGEKHILVTLTSQGAAVPAEVLDAVRRSPADWRFWFRLHPVDQMSRAREASRILREAGQDPTLLEVATETPLHALLPHMDAHVSVALSTVVLEAAANGVPSVACSTEAGDFYADQIASGMLVVAPGGPGILNALVRLLSEPRQPPRLEQPRAPRALHHLLSDFAVAGSVDPR
jgi:hypothetical protein